MGVPNPFFCARALTAHFPTVLLLPHDTCRPTWYDVAVIVKPL